MVETGKQQQSSTMALGRPPMPGLLEDMRIQKTINPKILSSEEETQSQQVTDYRDTEWYKRSHSSDRIDVRMQNLASVKSQLAALLPGSGKARMATPPPPPPPPMPTSGLGTQARRKQEPLPGHLAPRGAGPYVVEGNCIIFNDGMREKIGLPRTMKAAVVDTFEEANPADALVLSSEYVLPPRGELDADEVLVEIEYCALNNEDHRIASGIFKTGFHQTLPFIPGRDGVGKIVRMGSNVQRQYGFNVDDYVMGVSTDDVWGTFGQYSIMKASQICLKPASLSPRLAAMLPMSVMTAFEAFQKISKQLENTQRILILDNGHSAGTASVLTLLAKYYFLIDKVFVACPTDSLSYYPQIGADMVMDFQNEVFEDVVMRNFEEELTRLHTAHSTMPGTTATGSYDPAPHGDPQTWKKKEGAVDCVFDLIGSSDTQSRSYKLLSKKGNYVVMDFPQESSGRAETTTGWSKGGELLGMGKHTLRNKMRSYFGGTPRYQHVSFPEYDGRRLKSITEFLVDKQLIGKLRSEEYSWNELPSAVKKLHSTPYEGKIVIRFSS